MSIDELVSSRLQSVFQIRQSVMEFIELSRVIPNCRTHRRIIMEYWRKANVKRIEEWVTIRFKHKMFDDLLMVQIAGKIMGLKWKHKQSSLNQSSVITRNYVIFYALC